MNKEELFLYEELAKLRKEHGINIAINMRGYHDGIPSKYFCVFYITNNSIKEKFPCISSDEIEEFDEYEDALEYGIKLAKKFIN